MIARSIGLWLVTAVLIAGCAVSEVTDSPATTLQTSTEATRLAAIAANVEIIRDDFGVPHIYGKTDADAVFGLLYAQAEDDFPRIERNYVWACLLYTSPSPRDRTRSRMPSSA